MCLKKGHVATGHLAGYKTAISVIPHTPTSFYLSAQHTTSKIKANTQWAMGMQREQPNCTVIATFRSLM
jgi:hypothetical protein